MAHDMMFCNSCKRWVFYMSEWDVNAGCCEDCKRKREMNKKQNSNNNYKTLFSINWAKIINEVERSKKQKYK